MSETDFHPLDDFVDTKVTIFGSICNEPEDREFTQRFCFQPDDVEDGTDRIVVSTNRFPKYRYGDNLILSGKLELPENFQSYDGGPEFNYISYLEKDGIRYTMYRPRVEIADTENKSSRIVSGLIGIKSVFMGRVEAALPEPHSSLVAGLLLGEKGGMPQKVSEDFKKSGLTHILVLSGSNVTVVADALMRIFSFLPRVAGQVTGAVSIILFAVMTGASATTVRATLMALVLLMSRGIGRGYDVTRALSLAGVFMLLHNPRILAFDISFQLSFLATVAVIYVSPAIKFYLSKVPERFGLRETLAMTLGVQIFTLPFILYKMGEISVIALVPNLLVLPLVPYVMFGGFLSGVIGFVYPVAWATQIALFYILKTVSYFGSFSFATTKITINEWWLFASYILMLVAVRIITVRQQNSSQQISS